MERKYTDEKVFLSKKMEDAKKDIEEYYKG